MNDVLTKFQSEGRKKIKLKVNSLDSNQTFFNLTSQDEETRKQDRIYGSLQKKGNKTENIIM